MIRPVPTQTVCSTFDQTFTWNANKVLAGANHLDSPWYIIPVKSGCKIVRLQFFEISTVINDNGPGPFAFDIYAQFATPPPQYSPPQYQLSSLLPPVYASQSAILQRVDADAVPQGWTAQVTFSVTFSTSSFHLGPGVALADASGINYTDNRLTTTVQDSFGASFGFKGTTSYGYITIGPISSIQVQGTSEIQAASTSTSTTTSSSISEFDTAAIVLTLSALITVIAVTELRRERRIPSESVLSHFVTTSFMRSRSVRASSRPSA
jgi:hypothetical protein